jgi:N-acetylglucosaminyl-diphospho-decaprenol L-rhamnosyltransferase
MEKPRISVVVVTYNSASEISTCLAGLLPMCAPLLREVVVVDNASQDTTANIVHQHQGAILIRNRTNEGFASAVNRGFEGTTGEYVLVLNPDVIVNVRALEALSRDLDANAKYAAVGCRMMCSDGTPQASARRFPTIASFVGRLCFTNSVARWLRVSCEFGHWTDFTISNNGLTAVDWILGGCMLIRRLAYETIGGLDEKYFLYYEDIDWCFRARLGDWKVGFTSTAEVVHAYRRTSSLLRSGNPLIGVHLKSASRFFCKYVPERGIRTVF